MSGSRAKFIKWDVQNEVEEESRAEEPELSKPEKVVAADKLRYHTFQTPESQLGQSSTFEKQEETDDSLVKGSKSSKNSA